MIARSVLTVVAFVVILSCEVSGKCSIQPRKDSPTMFKATFSPCPVKLGRGNFINVSASAVAPRNVDEIYYKLVVYFADDKTDPFLEIDGSANCSSAKRPLPFHCPVKKGQQLGVKNLVYRLPDSSSVPLDSDSYYVDVTLYTGKPKKLEKLLSADVYFDLVSDSDGLREKPFVRGDAHFLRS